MRSCRTLSSRAWPYYNLHFAPLAHASDRLLADEQKTPAKKTTMKPTNFNFWILIAVVVILIAFAFVKFLKFNERNPKEGTVKINGHEITVEIADTVYKRTIGLSGHEPLEDMHGMLFVFPFSQKHTFWMRGMSFDLDMIWIQDRVAVHKEENIPHRKDDGTANLAPYKPKTPANYVLELSAGTAKKLGIETGSEVEISL
ncbi:MAG: hypothetical protein UW24_C0018G0029 [Parcubacteria group bacterium GW2011_GWA2_44_12]|nr:MAG: hypothetical protein UW24_C0018G0029 [Parcubacteria group bacterium GW2011_GWA2_44_12]